MNSKRVAIIGAGAGGLAAAVDMACAGWQVDLFERSNTVGGKMRQLQVAGKAIDAGPTVFTMRWVFEQLFADAGHNFQQAVHHRSAQCLARHFWTQGGQLDLHPNVAESANAIANFSNAQEAEGYRQFMADSARLYELLKDSFMAADKPNPMTLAKRMGLGGLLQLAKIAGTRNYWQQLDRYFRDPRLKQLFGRYATYVGSSPLQSPALLMLIAWVEQTGVWLLPGGMHSLACAMAQLAADLGVRIHLGADITMLDVHKGRVSGVTIGSSDKIKFDAVVYNGDFAALSCGELGEHVRPAAPVVRPAQRGLSAITWCANARTGGAPLQYHNVCFCDHYAEEFKAIFERNQITTTPTVYVCAQDRIDGHVPSDSERLLLLINAPASGDLAPMTTENIEGLRALTWQVLADCDIHIDYQRDNSTSTSPAEFHQLFQGSGGSLYGRATHGLMSSFARPGARTAIKGLYLAGGTVHPGPGVPMATLSGRLAANALLADQASG